MNYPVEILKKSLKKVRFEHSLRVADLAEKLAEHHGVDLTKARLAGMLHDSAKFMSSEEMLSEALKRGHQPTELEKKDPHLLHALLSSHLAAEQFKIKDPQILSAIKTHTFGKPRMSTLAKIIYLADHLEPARNFKGIKKVGRLAFTNINQALLLVAEAMIIDLLKKNRPIALETVRMRNYYLKHAEEKN